MLLPSTRTGQRKNKVLCKAMRCDYSLYGNAIFYQFAEEGGHTVDISEDITAENWASKLLITREERLQNMADLAARWARLTGGNSRVVRL